jgi:citrate lyase subunit beta/citryl-CoA lyase
MVKRIRRSFLYVPATREGLIRKGPNTDSDAIVHELDDGIGPRPEKKEAGRANLELIGDLDFGEKEVCVRINSLDSEFWFDDLQAALAQDVHTILIPKVNYPWHIRTAVETTARLVEDPPEFIFTIERTPGFAAIEEIIRTCGEYNDVTGIYPGFEAAELIGADITSHRIRSHFNLETMRYAPLGDLELYGTPQIELDDMSILRESLKREKELGFKGRLAIHPRQVAVINEVFTPTVAEYDRANEVIGRWEDGSRNGFRMDDGEFVDRPLVNAYRQVVNRYNLVHDIDERLELDHVGATEEG